MFGFLFKARFFRPVVIMVITALLMSMPQQGGFAQVVAGYPSAVSVLPHIAGVKVDVNNPFQLYFVVDQGSAVFSETDRQREYRKAVRYFMAALTIPNQDMWVNLSPSESERIIPDNFIQTEMGRDLLSQDNVLKQYMAALLHPETRKGKDFWEKIYQMAYKKFGTTDIPVDTFNKVWIKADRADIYEKGGMALVTDYHLKVMLERDYMTLAENRKRFGDLSSGEERDMSEIQKITADIVREIIVPVVEEEVNKGSSFAILRQIYTAQIMAAWYKEAIRGGALNSIYKDRSKVAGIETGDPQAKERIYRQYLDGLKAGVFNFIQEEVDDYTGELIPRKYFSGGMEPVDPAIFRKVGAEDASTASTIGRALAGVLFFAACAFIPVPAEGAIFQPADNVALMVTVEKGDTTGAIVEEIRKSFSEKLPDQYQSSVFGGSLWGEGGVVEKVTRDVFPDTGRIYPGDKYFFPRELVPASVAERLSGDSGGTLQEGLVKNTALDGTNKISPLSDELISGDEQVSSDGDEQVSLDNKESKKSSFWLTLAGGGVLWEAMHSALMIFIGRWTSRFGQLRKEKKLVVEKNQFSDHIEEIVRFPEDLLQAYKSKLDHLRAIKQDLEMKRKTSSGLTGLYRSISTRIGILEKRTIPRLEKILGEDALASVDRLQKEIKQLRHDIRTQGNAEKKKGMKVALALKRRDMAFVMRLADSDRLFESENARSGDIGAAAKNPGGVDLGSGDIHVQGGGSVLAYELNGPAMIDVPGFYPVIQGIFPVDLNLPWMVEMTRLLQTSGNYPVVIR